MWNDWEENRTEGGSSGWYRETDDGLSALYVDPRPHEDGFQGWTITLEYDQDGKTRTKKVVVDDDVEVWQVKSWAMGLDAGTRR